MTTNETCYWKLCNCFMLKWTKMKVNKVCPGHCIFTFPQWFEPSNDQFAFTTRHHVSEESLPQKVVTLPAQFVLANVRAGFIFHSHYVTSTQPWQTSNTCCRNKLIEWHIRHVNARRIEFEHMSSIILIHYCNGISTSAELVDISLEILQLLYNFLIKIMATNSYYI